MLSNFIRELFWQKKISVWKTKLNSYWRNINANRTEEPHLLIGWIHMWKVWLKIEFYFDLELRNGKVYSINILILKSNWYSAWHRLLKWLYCWSWILIAKTMRNKILFKYWLKQLEIISELRMWEKNLYPRFGVCTQ